MGSLKAFDISVGLRIWADSQEEAMRIAHIYLRMPGNVVPPLFLGIEAREATEENVPRET